MIGEGKFRADLSRAFDLLKDLDLGIYWNTQPNTDRDTTDLLRSSSGYAATYNGYVTRQAYDILLDDGSLLFFRRDPQNKTLLSYGYLEFPYDAMPYHQFINEYYGTDSYDEARASLEYEDYQTQAPLRLHVTPVRYDWSPALYREGAHPAAHLHLGHETEMRLAVDALLNPVQFVLFVIRHFYLEKWETKASRRADVIREAALISDEGLAPDFRNGRDLLELRLLRAATALGAADSAQRIPTGAAGRSRGRPS